MVDLETTGTGPEFSAIIQIAAVRFNLETREVDPCFFNRCLLIPPRRFWDEGTREWWCQKPELLRSIYNRMEEPELVVKDFYDWLGGPYESLTCWGKPITFEFPFISSYFSQFGYQNPLPYYKARDLRSFVAGIGNNFNEKDVEFIGTPHDALDDTLHQLRILYAALDYKCKPLISQELKSDC